MGNDWKTYGELDEQYIWCFFGFIAFVALAMIFYYVGVYFASYVLYFLSFVCGLIAVYKATKYILFLIKKQKILGGKSNTDN